MRHPYALMSFGLCAFVTATIAMEFFKGALAIRAKDGRNLGMSLIELTHRNTRRYGGYMVHMGIVLMFIGFTGSAFNQDVAGEVAQGESMRLGSYSLTLQSVQQGQNSNYLWAKALLSVAKDGRDAGCRVRCLLTRVPRVRGTESASTTCSRKACRDSRSWTNT